MIAYHTMNDILHTMNEDPSSFYILWRDSYIV